MAQKESHNRANRFYNHILRRYRILAVTAFAAQYQPRQYGNIIVRFDAFMAFGAGTWRPGNRQMVGDAVNHDIRKRPETGRKQCGITPVYKFGFMA